MVESSKLDAIDNPTWRVERGGVASLLVRAGEGDASYVALFELG